MRTVPLTLAQANDIVKRLHRHHKPVVGHRFSLGAVKGGKVVGCVIVGRPVARKTDQNNVAEVTRLTTDGTKNACSFLYAAAARVCREMGFTKIQTFVLAEEPGTSLRAAGWTFESMSAGGQWKHGTTIAGLFHMSNGPRRKDQPNGPKQKWSKNLNPEALWT